MKPDGSTNEENQPVQAELAAGGLVWSAETDARKLLVIRRGQRADWTLPKGKVKPEESLEMAAKREVEEETAVKAELLRPAGSTFYHKDDGSAKVVLYWHMRPEVIGNFIPNEEVKEIRWMLPVEAVALLTHASERELVQRESKGAGNQPFLRRWRSNARLDRLRTAIQSSRAQQAVLTALKSERMESSKPWLQSAATLLAEADKACEEGNLDVGWSLVHEADRLRLVALPNEMLAARALSLAQESEAKLKDWRQSTLKQLLAHAGTPADPPAVAKQLSSDQRKALESAVLEGCQVLNTHFNNRYHQLRIVGQNLSYLVGALSLTLALVLLLFSQVEFAGQPAFGNWAVISGVGLFGALGGALSALFQISRATAVKIPDSLLQGWITLGRPLIGAASALFIYTLLYAGLIQVLAPEKMVAAAFFAFAFASGFSERLVFRAVSQIEGSKKTTDG